MKEALVAVLAGFQSLEHDDARERPIDRLMALMNASQRSQLASVGKDLIAFKYANRAEYHDPAIQGLADALDWPRLRLDPRIRLNLTAPNRLKIAGWAVHEWTIDFCAACSGRGEVPAHAELQQGLDGRQPMLTCPTCSGTRKRRYSDQERAEALGDMRGAERAMSHAHGLIGAAESLAITLAAEIARNWGTTKSA